MRWNSRILTTKYKFNIIRLYKSEGLHLREKNMMSMNTRYWISKNQYDTKHINTIKEESKKKNGKGKDKKIKDVNSFNIQKSFKKNYLINI